MSPLDRPTFAEHARRLAITPAALVQAIKDGRFSLVDGRLSPSDAGQLQQPATPAQRPAAGPADAATAPNPAGVYADARSRREAAEAERAEIELGKLKGELLDREATVRGIFTAVRAMRDSLMTIPSRTAAKLVGKPVHEVRMTLETEIRAALVNLSKQLDSQARRGALPAVDLSHELPTAAAHTPGDPATQGQPNHA